METTELVEAYLKGVSLRELSSQSGNSLKRCREILVQEGVDIRPPGRAPGPRQGVKLSDEDQICIEVRYRNGDTMQEIANDYEVSKQRIHQILGERGINSRRRGPRSS